MHLFLFIHALLSILYLFQCQTLSVNSFEVDEALAHQALAGAGCTSYFKGYFDEEIMTEDSTLKLKTCYEKECTHFIFAFCKGELKEEVIKILLNVHKGKAEFLPIELVEISKNLDNSGIAENYKAAVKLPTNNEIQRDSSKKSIRDYLFDFNVNKDALNDLKECNDASFDFCEVIHGKSILSPNSAICSFYKLSSPAEDMFMIKFDLEHYGRLNITIPMRLAISALSLKIKLLGNVITL